jgi:septal ring factor EnvC (AmiA/AmiB activator)
VKPTSPLRLANDAYFAELCKTPLLARVKAKFQDRLRNHRPVTSEPTSALIVTPRPKRGRVTAAAADSGSGEKRHRSESDRSNDIALDEKVLRTSLLRVQTEKSELERKLGLLAAELKTVKAERDQLQTTATSETKSKKTSTQQLTKLQGEVAQEKARSAMYLEELNTLRRHRETSGPATNMDDTVKLAHALKPDLAGLAAMITAGSSSRIPTAVMHSGLSQERTLQEELVTCMESMPAETRVAWVDFISMQADDFAELLQQTQLNQRVTLKRLRASATKL